MIVIDCSLVIAALMPDEAADESLKIIQKIAQGYELATVPVLFYTEIANALLIAKKRNRISQESFGNYMSVIYALTLQVDSSSVEESIAKKICDYAEKHRLTAYDASYLELAMRKKCTLASLDGDLMAAARAEGCSAF